MVIGARASSAQSFPSDEYADFSSDRSVDSYRNELARERYQTAIAKERAERAYLEHQASMYEYQRRQQENYQRSTNQQQDYYRNSNNINTVNQAANTAANIARQIQVLSHGGYGW